jgi:hypothetical protein
VLGLDHYAPFLLSAFGITLVVLGGYALYLRSRLNGVRRRAAADAAPGAAPGDDAAYSARNVTAAAPRAATAQAASNANGPSSA